MDTSRKIAIEFLTWVGRCCIYAGDGFWIYYKRFYTVKELFDKYEEIMNGGFKSKIIHHS